MKRFAMVLLALLLCVLCFGCSTSAPDPDADIPINNEQGSGNTGSGPFEYAPTDDPTTKPVFYVLVAVSGVIALTAAGVLIFNARKKQKE